jgi:hypothetical protein
MNRRVQEVKLAEMKVAELENISQHVVQLTREVEDAKKRELEHRNAINKEQASETAEMIN